MPSGSAQANFARKRKSFALRGKRRLGRWAMHNKKRPTDGRMPSRVPVRQRRVRRPGPRTVAMRVDLPSPMTTRFTQAVTSIADIKALERLPYDSVVPARNLYQLFEAT